MSIYLDTRIHIEFIGDIPPHARDKSNFGRIVESTPVAYQPDRICKFRLALCVLVCFVDSQPAGFHGEPERRNIVSQYIPRPHGADHWIFRSARRQPCPSDNPSFAN